MPVLPFGAMFTAVQGANGSGKTPVMKGIMLALGHELNLPPESRRALLRKRGLNSRLTAR